MVAAAPPIPRLAVAGALRDGDNIGQLCHILQRIFPVRFRLGRDTHYGGAAAGESATRVELDETEVKATIPHFVVDQTAPLCSPGESDWRIEFADDGGLEPFLRQRHLAHTPLSVLRPVSLREGDRILAKCGGQPIWVLRAGPDGMADVVSLPLPVLDSGEGIIDHLNGHRFVQLLPLVHFLKRIALEAGWRFPTPRACLMFDDPNLHWPSYGFVSYPEIVESAKRVGYHVAFATVPLDGWFVHRRTAALFRDNSQQISLLIHGNVHLYAELASPGNAATHDAIAREAIRRVESLERRSGVRVHRVIAPPHGACSFSMMRSLLSHGIEGAFISPWSLRIWNPTNRWAEQLGVLPAEVLASGFPVAPRFRLSANDEGSIVIAALLGRPIVPVGHHGDLANGIGVLEMVAGLVNRLHKAEWADPTTILRTNFLSQVSDGVLFLRPYSTRFQFAAPQNAEAVVIEVPVGHEDCQVSLYRLRNLSTDQEIMVLAGEVVPVRGGQVWEATNAALGDAESCAIGAHPAIIWALTRRLLCEARDRLAPARRRLTQWRERFPRATPVVRCSTASTQILSRQDNLRD